MAGVTDTDMVDLIRTTRDNLPNMQFELPMTYQNYEIMGSFLKEDRLDMQGGKSIIRDIQLRNSRSAHHVQLYQEEDVNVTNVMYQLTVPWRHASGNWSIERREQLINSPTEKFVDLVESRRSDASLAVADELEERGWQSPTDSTDKLNPWGIPHWIVKAGSDGTEGFEGKRPSGYTDVAGIDPDDTDYGVNFRNWVARGTGYYEGFDVTLLDTMQKAFLKINFKGPQTLDDFNHPMFKGFRIYVNVDTRIGLHRLARQQNDQLGFDLVANQGLVSFMRTPVVYVSYLDGDATDPIYFINKHVFFTAVLKGDYLRESDPVRDRKNHNVWTTFLDLSYNFMCINRRLCAVISK